MTIDTILSSAAVSPGSTWQKKMSATLLRALGRIRVGWKKRRTRMHLASLTEDQLRDVGITPAEARQEAKRSLFVYSFYG